MASSGARRSRGPRGWCSHASRRSSGRACRAIASHGSPVLPCRPPLSIEGQEDLDWQVAAFDAMALPGPPSWGTDRTRVRACPERVAAVSGQQRDECRGSDADPCGTEGSLYSTIGRSSPCAAGSLILSAACVRLRACRGRPCTCTLESTACAAEMRDFRVHRNGPAITRARPLEPFAIGSAIARKELPVRLL